MKKSSKVSSRLAKNQQNKIAKQTLFIVGLAVVLVLLFLFVVVPGVIRVAGNLLSTGSFNVPEDTIPPRVPSISAPGVATSSATIVLDGFGEPESEIVIVLNGSEYEKTKADENGEFSIKVALEADENEIGLYSVDEAGNESNLSQNYSVVFDPDPPVIELEEPQDGQQIELKKNQNTTIKGTTEPNSKVYLNERLLFVKSDGSFSGNYQLQEGENKLFFRVIDQAGNQSEQEITVNFRY